MNSVLESIARENFRSSGYITHPSRERRVRWIFTSPPRTPGLGVDAVHSASRRRERALARSRGTTSLFKTIFHAVFSR